MKKGILTRALGLVLAISLVLPQASVTANAAAPADTELELTSNADLSDGISEDTEVTIDDSSDEDSSDIVVEEDLSEDDPTEGEIVVTDDITTEEDAILDDAATEASSAIDEEEASEDASEADSETVLPKEGVGGKVGNVTWNLDSNGTFTLSGSGVMEDVDIFDNPWADYKKSINKVIVKGTISAIGKYAFYDCSNLTEVVFSSKKLTTIKSYAFENTAISKLTLPKTLTTIGDNAFENCKLTSITIPSEVEAIGQYAFADNLRLATVNINSTRINSVETSVFYNCDISKVTLPANMTSIPAYMFWHATFAYSGCTITIPKTVKTIGTYAFCTASNLSSGPLQIVFEKGSQLTTIGSYAFDDRKLYKITLPESLETIGSSAFSGTKLSEITIPSNVQTIGDNAFEECTALAKVVIKSKKIKSVGYGIFNQCAINKVVFPDGIKEIPAYLFCQATFDSYSLTIPKTVTSIGAYAFYSGGLYSKSIKELKFENGSQLKSIGKSAFYDNKIYSLSLPSKLESIGDYAFAETLIDDLVIPSGVKTIDYCAFEECPNLYRITLPASLNEIGFKAFSTTDDKTIKCSVKKGTYAYEYIVKNAQYYRYVIISTSSIAYVLNGGTNTPKNPSVYETGETLNLYSPSRKGYTFKGWFLDSKFKKSWKEVDTSKGGKLTFYAKWAANKYTIKFNKNGATSGTMKNLSATYGKSVTLTQNAFKRTGYQFTGWNTKKNGSGTTYKNAASVKNLSSNNKGTVTLYAQWKKNS